MTLDPQAPMTIEDRYRLLVDAVTDYAIYQLDPAGRVSSWNSGAQRIKGYASEEILGEDFARFYTDEDRANGRPALTLQTVRTAGRFEGEGWRVRKDGTRFWAHVVVDPILSPDGGLVGYAKITRDLTERREAEASLRVSENQFRLLVQGVTDYAIYLLDPHGNVANWNSGAQRIKGYSPDEIVGRHFSTFYTDQDRARGLPAMALDEATRTGRFRGQGMRVRKDGTNFLANVIIDAIRDEDKRLIGFAKVTRDITEQRNAELALEQARETLYQTRKLDAVGQLTGGIAHDFNNLLMAILGSLDLLQRRIPEGPQTEPLIRNATEAAKRGVALTQRMLAFARKRELAAVDVDLSKLVQGMSDLITRSIGPMFTLAIDVPSPLAHVTADANQLEMSLLNLAVNARDAMPEGGEIRIAASESVLKPRNSDDLPPGRYVSLKVIDHGVGMDDLTLARAPEPFFTTKGVGKGTGLGLSMVHGMAEQLGGRLRLSSRPGQGTTIEILLPAKDHLAASAANSHSNAEQVAQSAIAAPPAQVPGPGIGRRLRVLAVDDDALVLANLAAMLEELEHSVVAVTSPAQALLHLTREAPFDLLITDQAMPEMTGLELAARVGQSHPDLDIIIVTGYAKFDGPIAYTVLNKPFDLNQLADAIAQLA